MQGEPKFSNNGHNASGKPNSASSLRVRNGTPKMSAVVKGKDGKFKPWSEKAEITSLSSSGAGFFMARSCEPGRLVSLMMPMPLEMRRYDEDKRLYRVWGLVQYCYEAGGDGSEGFHVGVALIGKEPPESYNVRPNQCYRVSGMSRNGLWKVEELERPFRKRSATRYWNSINTALYRLDEKGHPIASEKTVTENISETGASVYSRMRVAVGDRIKFQSSSPVFSSLCVVRCRRIGVDDRTRVHLQFVEKTFPILDIESPIEEDGEH